ncbi:MAG TPA: protein kinase [Thermoanaerobaculia bacterium]|jgi:serine/threonine-protein kinase|nr:protein kinase [Thermoanaerobaculia bacterium]
MAERRDISERYRITRKLGESAFTSVHAATDATNGAMVVVKRIAPGRNTEAMPRFLQTATALAKLRHPTIPSLLDFGMLPDGGAFLLLEPVAGRGLEELTGAAPAEVLSHLLQVVDGLELLSRSGIAHGNLTPENIRLAGTTTGEQAKLLGFGTRLLHPPIPGMPGVEGTAPETFAEGRSDSRSDVYSFARVACRLLDIGMQLDSRGEPELALPLGVSFELEDAEALRQALARSLRRSPAERPSWGEIREGLRTALRGPVAQPSVGEKTNPVYIPPSATDGEPLALRFEEAFEAPPAATPLSEILPALEVPPTPPPAVAAPVVPSPAAIATPKPHLPVAESRSPESLPNDLLPSVEDFLAGPAVAPIPQKEVAPAFAVPMKPPDTAEIPIVPRPIRPRGKSKRALWLALAAAAGLGVLAAFLIYLRDRDVDPSEIQDELKVPAAPAATASPPPIALQSTLVEVIPVGNPGLAAARTALDAGNIVAARAALDALDAPGAAALSPEEREEAKALRDSLGQSQVERLAADLKRGLRNGNAATLRSALRGIAANRIAFFKANPGAEADFGRAQQIVDLAAQLQRAAKAGDSLAVVRLAGSFSELAPRDKSAPRLRDQAAATIEAEADRLSQSGQAQAALDRLEALRGAWPDRPGLSERIGRIRTVAEVDPRLDRILANAQAAAQRKRPDEGLAILRTANPTGPYVERFRELSDRLKSEFSQMDQNPPAIELREGSASEFEKGTTTRVSLRISDDFQVAKATLFARPEGGAWQALELRQSGAFYTAEIPPSFHQNKNVQWYATATDVSGHSGQLGSESAPRTLKRKKWFDRLRGGKEGDGG